MQLPMSPPFLLTTRKLDAFEIIEEIQITSTQETDDLHVMLKAYNETFDLRLTRISLPSNILMHERNNGATEEEFMNSFDLFVDEEMGASLVLETSEEDKLSHRDAERI